MDGINGGASLGGQPLFVQFVEEFLHREIHVPQDTLQNFGMKDIVPMNGNGNASTGGVVVDVVAAAGESEPSPVQ